MLDAAAGGAEGIAGERYRHAGCPIEASPAPGVFVDSRRESKDRIGMPTPPRHFCQRVRKLLKTKGGERKKSGKREKECARIRN